MKRFIPGVVSIFLLLASCAKDPARNQAIKHLWRIERHALQGPGICHVTYYSYDAQDRITQTLWYKVDSTGPTLDSVLVQKTTYQYSGTSFVPEYAEWRNNSVGSPPNYGLFGTERTYSGSQLVKDSTYLISSIPVQTANSVISNISTAGNQVSSLVYSGTILYSKDTCVISGGNMIRAVSSSQLSNLNFVNTFSFDNKINPINVPVKGLGLSGQFTIIPNANNILTSLFVLNSGSDSVRRISQFQYDSDNYPIQELQEERIYFLPPATINYVINYRYY